MKWYQRMVVAATLAAVGLSGCIYDSPLEGEVIKKYTVGEKRDRLGLILKTNKGRADVIVHDYNTKPLCLLNKRIKVGTNVRINFEDIRHNDPGDLFATCFSSDQIVIMPTSELEKQVYESGVSLESNSENESWISP